jgi:hypothetical protein
MVYIEEANAYLDPGTGSYFFQLLIATVIGGLFFFKQLWKKILHIVKKFFTKNQRDV